MSRGVAGRYLTTTEAAAILGVCVETVRRWLRDGHLPGRKIAGGRWLIPREAVDE